MKIKEYRIRVRREYTTDVFLKFPDDGRDHKKDLNDKMIGGDSYMWDHIAEEELKQMDIAHEDYEITLIK
jgi:hypothetical protein